MNVCVHGVVVMAYGLQIKHTDGWHVGAPVMSIGPSEMLVVSCQIPPLLHSHSNTSWSFRRVWVCSESPRRF